jgi:hypothetical protein
MQSKYFSTDIKPIMPGNIQQAAYADTEILFDWTEFEIPRGPGKMLGVTALVEGVNGADQAGAIDIELFFARTNNLIAPPTLGTTGALVTKAGWKNHVIGRLLLDASADSNNGDLVYVNVMKHQKQPNIVMQGEPLSGSTIGVDKFYVAAISKGALDFSTTVIARGGGAVGDLTIDTDKGSNDDPDAELIFAPGDVLHGGTGAVLGTVKSIAAFASNTQVITLESPGLVEALDDNEEIYNASPIRLKIDFEK